MSVIKEFKEFALKGNLIDMTIAFVIGGGFGKVVTGFIDGIIMPIVGKLTAGVDFRSLKIVLSEAQYNAAGKIIKAEAAIRYGEFITLVIDFTLVAFVMFMVIKAVNRLKRNQTPVAPPPSKEEILLTEIRDLLKTK